MSFNFSIPSFFTSKDFRVFIIKGIVGASKKTLTTPFLKYSLFFTNESIFLEPLFEILNKGESQAEIWKKMYYDVWGKNVDFIYKENYFGK